MNLWMLHFGRDAFGCVAVWLEGLPALAPGGAGVKMSNLRSNGFRTKGISSVDMRGTRFAGRLKLALSTSRHKFGATGV